MIPDLNLRCNPGQTRALSRTTLLVSLACTVLFLAACTDRTGIPHQFREDLNRVALIPSGAPLGALLVAMKSKDDVNISKISDPSGRWSLRVEPNISIFSVSYTGALSSITSSGWKQVDHVLFSVTGDYSAEFMSDIFVHGQANSVHINEIQVRVAGREYVNGNPTNNDP